MIWFGFDTGSSYVTHELDLDILLSPCNVKITGVHTCLTYSPMSYVLPYPTFFQLDGKVTGPSPCRLSSSGLKIPFLVWAQC